MGKVVGQELARLGQKELKLMEERRDLEKLLDTARQPQPQPKESLWGVTGSITGARKVGFRRGLYRISQDYLGFYEKSQSVKENPFRYKGK